MQFMLKLSIATLCALLLVACGGGGGSASTTTSSSSSETVTIEAGKSLVPESVSVVETK